MGESREYLYSDGPPRGRGPKGDRARLDLEAYPSHPHSETGLLENSISPQYSLQEEGYMELNNPVYLQTHPDRDPVNFDHYTSQRNVPGAYHGKDVP